MSSIHDALPSNWTAVGNRSTASGPMAAAARAWLGEYEAPVLRAVERAGPAASTWLEARLDLFADANNLTEVHQLCVNQASEPAQTVWQVEATI